MNGLKSELKYEDMPSSWRWILDDAYEAQGDFASIGYQVDNSDFETLVDKGLLKKVMVQSGLHPKYGYKITQKGIQTVLGKPQETTDEINKLRAKVDRLQQRINRYDEIVRISRATAPEKREFLATIDLEAYDLKERFPEDYIDYIAYSQRLSDDILWYGYKWARDEREKDIS